MTSVEDSAMPARLNGEQTAADEMERYGITCVPVDYFHYKGSRYASLTNAIAQAKRHNFRRSPYRNVTA
jgi:hypothetical protein